MPSLIANSLVCFGVWGATCRQLGRKNTDAEGGEGACSISFSLCMRVCVCVCVCVLFMYKNSHAHESVSDQVDFLPAGEQKAVLRKAIV